MDIPLHSNTALGIGELLQKYERPTQEKKGGVTSERAEQIEKLMIMIRENPKDGKRFAYWLGRTKRFSTHEIYVLCERAKNGRNPGALLNHLIKNS